MIEKTETKSRISAGGYLKLLILTKKKILTAANSTAMGERI
jgi:hypothetical protein